MTGPSRVLLFLAVGASLHGAARAGELGIVRVVCDHETESVHFTGTHIGRGLILTCGHCCRDAGGPDASVRILVLSDERWMPVRRTTGRVVCANPRADVGLIRLDDPSAMGAAHRLAPRGSRFQPGDPAAIYRWTKREDGWQLRPHACKVTRIDPFLELSLTEVECPIRPGDSGSPLVSVRTRLLMGVASGVTPHNGRSLYASLNAVYDLLDRCPASSKRSTGIRRGDVESAVSERHRTPSGVPSRSTEAAD